jgi:hypothetical protein
MDSFEDFLRELLFEGRAVFRRKPGEGEAEAGPLRVLEKAFERARREIAGPRIPFDPQVSLAAAKIARRACWALVNRQQRPEDLVRSLRMPGAPTMASQHFSADLTLRFLPQIHQRARSIDPADVLVRAIADLLRNWPLSGVLADLEDGPETPIELGNHPGLLLLYAERFAEHPREAWKPVGRAAEYVELVAAGGAHV